MVSHHRPARRRQDDGADQFRPEVSARRRQRGDGDPGRRRNALLRLVVHRRGGAHRHRRPLHHSGFGRQGRSQELAGLSRHAASQPPAPTDQRRHRRDQHRRRAPSLRRRSRRARRRDSQAPHRIARRTEDRLPRLRRLHQDGPDRRLHPVFRRSRRSQTTGGLGRDVPDLRQEGQQRRQSPRGDGSADPARLRANAGALAGGAGPALARDPVRPARPAQRHPQADRRFSQPHLRADALPDDGDAARILLHLGHAGGHALRFGHRRAAKELRRRKLRRGGVFRNGQELFPPRSPGQGGVRRSGMGVDQHRRGAPLLRAARGAVRADRPRHDRHARAVVDEL